MAGLNSGQVRIAGTGRLLKAPLGTVLPVDSVAAWDPKFIDLGYADDGFEMKQDLKRKEVNGWQTLELLRLITTALNRSFTFNLKQTNKDTLALAWGGAAITPTPGISLGTVAIAITTGVLTVSATETLAVGDMVQLGHDDWWRAFGGWHHVLRPDRTHLDHSDVGGDPWRRVDRHHRIWHVDLDHQAQWCLHAGHPRRVADRGLHHRHRLV